MELRDTLDNRKFVPFEWCKYILPKLFKKCTICYHKLYKSNKHFICFECKNVYHFNCIENWFNQNEYLPCPNCRCNKKWSCFGS